MFAGIILRNVDLLRITDRPVTRPDFRIAVAAKSQVSSVIAMLSSISSCTFELNSSIRRVDSVLLVTNCDLLKIWN